MGEKAAGGSITLTAEEDEPSLSIVDGDVLVCRVLGAPTADEDRLGLFVDKRGVRYYVTEQFRGRDTLRRLPVPLTDA